MEMLKYFFFGAAVIFTGTLLAMIVMFLLSQQCISNKIKIRR